MRSSNRRARARLAAAVSAAVGMGSATGAAGAATAGAAFGATEDGYPTVARVDYVLGCMAANGNTREVMAKCACSIDVIASLLPYADYERAETVLGMHFQFPP